MKKNQFLSLITASFLCMAGSHTQNTDPGYFNEIPPGTTPAVFAHGKVSRPDQFEFGADFSKDRSEFYYGVAINGKAETRMMKFKNGSWTPPVTILIHDVYSYNDPFLSPDEKKLFFISDRPLNGLGPKKDYDIWRSEERRVGKESRYGQRREGG